ncbi:MAG: ABC transporter ATP-binding protein [Bacteroidetes bacterium]|nr:ABC transporter ATP-binding protein [Bacteroidota bacterium]MBU2508621.1 ABC transporter ATP-binding protein [Bacteroidota bacterium]
MKNVIRVNNLHKIFTMGEVKVNALRGVDLEINYGEFLAVMGSSGSGKSTLMNLLGCLDQPTDGSYFLDDVDTSKLAKNDFADIRNQKIGFVFQGFNLLPRTNALDNVELPLLYDRHNRIQNSHESALQALETVGLSDRIHHEPNQLSGGQQQRVAIARALVNNPAIILADEPTGNLDSRTSIEVFEVFQALNDSGITIILVTHERDFAKFAKRIVEMKDGVIIKDYLVKDRLFASDLKNNHSDQDDL